MRKTDTAELGKSFDYSVGNLQEAVTGGKQRFEEQRHWLDLLPKDIKTIADVGCGAGFHSKYFKERGMTPTAIDTSKLAFQFSDEIEFLQADLFSLPKDRKFDAIFCSHTLEHTTDPYMAVQKMRDSISDEGYLIIVVPPYDPQVCEGHRTVGWNISQTAMLLVDCGFDCRDSIFSQFGIHVCGFGKKTKVDQTMFSIERSLKYLPKGLSDHFFTKEGQNFIDGRLAHADKNHSWRIGQDVTFSFPNFNWKNYFELSYKEKEWKSKDVYVDENQSLDLSTDEITIIVFVEGSSCSVRLALGNGRKDKPFESCTELWISLEPGLNVRKHSIYDFKILRGRPTYSRINHFSFGGWCTNSKLRIWILDKNGKVLIQ